MQFDIDQITLWIKADEGGYVCNPHDPGGATNYGITARELAAWRHAPVSEAAVFALQWVEAKTIIVAQYLKPVCCDQLPAGLDYCLADASVNSGPVQATKWLQRALGVDPDGHMGVVTVAAAKAASDVPSLIKRYNGERLGFMHALRIWKFFGKGWSDRVQRVTDRALQLARAAQPKATTEITS